MAYNFFSKAESGKKKRLGPYLIVLIFTLAHAIVCFFTHDTEIGDGMFLTPLTIGMVYMLIRFYRIHFEVFLGLTFLSTFAGYYLGTEGDELFTKIFPEWGIWINILITSAVTTLMGLVIILLLHKNWRKIDGHR